MHAQNRPKFTYLGHSTVLCELRSGETLLIDPWVLGNPRCPNELKTFERIDAILITHGHGDHLGDAVALAKKYKPQVVVGTYEVCTWLAGQGVENCSGMNIGGTQRVLSTRVTQVQAFHTSSISDGDRVLVADSPTGFVVRLDNGYTFYHAGDTCVFLDMQLIADLYRPALAFLPIGDHFTMDPHQAARACKLLEVRQVVPIHWGTFPLLTGTPAMLKSEIKSLGVNCEMVALQPGESY